MAGSTVPTECQVAARIAPSGGRLEPKRKTGKLAHIQMSMMELVASRAAEGTALTRKGTKKA